MRHESAFCVEVSEVREFRPVMPKEQKFCSNLEYVFYDDLGHFSSRAENGNASD